MNPDYLHGITLSVNKITKARNEVELYHSITESLINDFGFDRVTVRKVDWERCRLCLVSYDGFTDEINTFDFLYLGRQGGGMKSHSHCRGDKSLRRGCSVSRFETSA